MARGGDSAKESSPHSCRQRLMRVAGTGAAASTTKHAPRLALASRGTATGCSALGAADTAAGWVPPLVCINYEQDKLGKGIVTANYAQQNPMRDTCHHCSPLSHVGSFAGHLLPPMTTLLSWRVYMPAVGYIGIAIPPFDCLLRCERDLFYRPYQVLWVDLFNESRPEQPTNCPSSLTGLHQRVKGKL